MDERVLEVSRLGAGRWIGFGFALAGLLVFARSAQAIDAGVARTCNALVEKSFPPREPGNPAAGSAKGDANAQRAFFQLCVAKGGKMDSDPAKSSTAGDSAPNQAK